MTNPVHHRRIRAAVRFGVLLVTGLAGAVAPAGGVEAQDLEPRPRAIRGLYVNAWAAGSRARLDTLLAVARATEVNALVIDIKDASGYVSHASQVESVRAAGATGQIRIRDLAAVVDRIRAAGLYPIARIVVAKDPILTAARPDWAIRDSAGGVWADARGNRWLNLWQDGVREYHTDLAEEVVRAGFSEIQWDYIRFPDAPAETRASARFPGAQGRQVEAVERFLAEARRDLAPTGARMTADVFGITTSARHDVGVGQVWESFIAHVDDALPMIYPSHFRPGSHRVSRPADRPYEIVRAALEAAVERNRAIAGAGGIVPWLQDFSWGRGTVPYGAAEVRAQIQAAYDAGVNGWILWNSGSKYTIDALEPAGGWVEEPGIRIGGEVVPVSQRGEWLSEPTRGAPPQNTARRPARSAPSGSSPSGPA
ncbi:MAG: putative glycoside hydrolase [Gemmatimonadetes bacterium]|nr:putative glycoside hydrolase [Gemmatimonadota bacterium]